MNLLISLFHLVEIYFIYSFIYLFDFISFEIAILRLRRMIYRLDKFI